MKILLLNPPFLKKFSRSQRSPAVTKSGTIYFPMWLSYAAGVLMENGFEVELIDAPADGYSIDDTIAKAVKFQPRLIIMETSTPSIYNDAAVAGDLKEICPSSFIVLVGTHVSALPDETLNINKGVDAIARHEYDYTLLDLARTLEKGGDLNNVKGISFRSGKGITHIPDRSYIENLDELPFVSKVYKKFLKVENYFNPNALYPMVTITTSRGCPFKCTFCVYPQTMMGHKLRLRSVENVVEEIEYIIRSFNGAKSIFFEDDTFTTIKKRCIEISNEILKRGIRILWTANARADLDYETMKVMKEAGCRCLCVGFESGSQQLLDNIKKKIGVEKMRCFMADAKRAGILIHGCFMVGLPGETEETMKQTLKLARELNPDTVQFYPVMVYPGTEAYDWYNERGLISTNDFSRWLTPGGLHNTVIRTESLSSEELVMFCDDARRAFYLRPRYFLYKVGQMITSPEEIKRNLKSARTFIKYLVRGSDIRKKI